MKQRTLLNKDLSRFEKEFLTAPISLHGAIATTLVALEKTIAQYAEHFKEYELNNPEEDEETKAKYRMRLETLKQDHADAKAKFQELKDKYSESNARDQLLRQSSSMVEETIMNKRNVVGTMQPMSEFGNREDGNLERTVVNSAAGLPLYEGLRKEASIFERSNAQLDRILQIGQESLDDMMEQNQVLQRLQNQMNKSLHTLGVSHETIQKINKRVFKDKLIFYVALLLFFLGIYFVLKLFG